MHTPCLGNISFLSFLLCLSLLHPPFHSLLILFLFPPSSSPLSPSCSQLLDLPGIIEGAKDGKGRGRQVIAVARTCSLIFIVLDVLKPLQHKKLIEHELEGFGIRLNKTPPNIGFRKKDKGGLNLTLQVKSIFILTSLPSPPPSHPHQAHPSHRFPSHTWI